MREGAGFSYDPPFGGLILFGGVNETGASDNDTWLFTSSGWSNITTTVGTPQFLNIAGDPLNWSYGGMAWDPGLGGIVVVDGCAVSQCIGNGEEYGITLLLTGTGWSYYEAGPGTDLNGTYLGYNSLAYDYASQELVAYGGYDYYAGYTNYTYTMNSTGVWVNITNDDAGCSHGVCYTPPGRVSNAITWDGQLSSVFMAEGYNGSTGTWLNDSWLFTDGAWFPTNLTAPNPPANFCASAWPTMATVSDNVAPFILGGSAPSSEPACYSTEWVFEVPPQATLTETPHSTDLGAVSTFTAGWVAGTGTGIVAGWNLTFGDDHFTTVRAAAGQNSSTAYTKAFPYTYPASGTFVANVTWSDFFYIASDEVSVSVSVYPALVASITASATSITTGGQVTFTTSPTGGSGTYTYAWSFGDGTTSTVQDPPAHTFAKAGSFAVNLTVTDSSGNAVKNNVTITVKAASTGASLSGSTLTYLVLGIVVLLVVVVAVVLLMRRRKKPASAQPWQTTGAPPPGAGAPPPGAGGNVPPGAGGSSPPPPPP